MSSRLFWALCLACIIGLGILSRVVHTGLSIFDKYLGDALYAAMVYAILRLLSKPTSVVVWTAVIMTAIEFFQLTMIPFRMLSSPHLIVRICARLMGTQFSWLDLFTYAIGIGCMFILDLIYRRTTLR